MEISKILKTYSMHLISLFIASLIVEIIDTKSLMFIQYSWTAWKSLILVCILFSIFTTYLEIGFNILMCEINKK